MKHLQKKKNILNEQGFSMIELIIALALLAIGMLAVAQMQITAIQGNGAANNLSRAATLGSDRMEKIIKYSYEDALLTDGTHDDPENPVDNFYTVSWTVTSDAEGKNKSVKLLVEWTERGKSKKIEFDYVKPADS